MNSSGKRDYKSEFLGTFSDKIMPFVESFPSGVGTGLLCGSIYLAGNYVANSVIDIDGAIQTGLLTGIGGTLGYFLNKK